MPDYPLAQEHYVPRSFMFNSNACRVIVIHKTGGDATPQAVYNTFMNSGNPGKSVHYAVGQDGSIWQYVPEALGAGGNGITDNTMQPFWQPYVDTYGNLNVCTISIEHCDPSRNNDTPLTPAQQDASFKLVAYLVAKYRIAADHIKPHNSIVSTGCPGTYPMNELINYINGDNTQERNTWLNASQQAQAAATWASTTTGAIPSGGLVTAPAGLFAQGQMPNYNTGIALSWQENYMNGINYGPPTSYEYGEVGNIPLTDWTGALIVQQNFMGGRCEWKNGQGALWYPWAVKVG